MKVIGIILIIAGILMFIFRGVSFTKEEKLADIGPVEINKKENKTVAWPMYAGGIAVVAGIIIILVDKKSKYLVNIANSVLTTMTIHQKISL